MTIKYRLHIEISDTEFRWDGELYKIPKGTKSFTIDVSEAELVERIRSVVPERLSFSLMKVERL